MDVNIDELLNQSYPPGNGAGMPVGLPPEAQGGTPQGGMITMEVTQEEAAMVEQMRAMKAGGV